MTRNEIIASLEEQATDKEDFVTEGDPDDIFALDIQALREAAELLRKESTDSRAMEGLCCDCLHGGPCCSPDENTACEHRQEDGRCWTASRLNRNRWEGCDSCKSEVIKTGMKHVGYKFCPYCGKPVTEEAWTELEQRIGGNT